VIKQIDLFGLTVTCSDVYAIGSILGLNLLQEYFGRENAKRATWICFFLMIFFALMSSLHLFYLPSAIDATHSSFSNILSPAPRLLLASLATFLLVQKIDIAFFSFLQRIFPKAPLALRTGTSLLLSQLLDTALFSFLGLYGIVNSLAEVFIWSFLVKLILIVAMMPALSFLKRSAHDPL
jgi:uncharacterized integral membrane protein (TIGR00697 family)